MQIKINSENSKIIAQIAFTLIAKCIDDFNIQLLQFLHNCNAIRDQTNVCLFSTVK